MRIKKNNHFKFSSTGLKKAQETLRKKEVFEVNDTNYEDYEKFILNSYVPVIDVTKRVEIHNEIS